MKIIKKFLIIVGIIISFITLLSPLLFIEANAASSNIVELSSKTYTAESSGIIYCRINARGKAGDRVLVSYHTESINAIAGKDYKPIRTTATITLTSGTTSYDFSIQTYTRPTFNVINNSSNESYARSFKLILDDVKNGEINNEASEATCLMLGDKSVRVAVDNKFSYLVEYTNVQTRSDGGTDAIDGETWYRSIDHVSLNNTVTRNWVTSFIDTGLAKAYSGVEIKFLSDAQAIAYSSNVIYFKIYTTGYYGGRNGAEALTCDVEPCDRRVEGDRGAKFDGYANTLAAKGENPYIRGTGRSKYLDMSKINVKKPYKTIYWKSKGSTWYASQGSLTYNVMYYNEPYNGVLNTGFEVYNTNYAYDRECSDYEIQMALVDDTAPRILESYVDTTGLSSTGKLKIIIRFSEPVYSISKKDLVVHFNSNATNYYATYAAGNYTDTLTYEIDGPHTNISKLTYELPSKDIYDLSYSIDEYSVEHNIGITDTDSQYEATILNGNINYTVPKITAEMTESSSYHNYYNFIVSISDVSAGGITSGDLYYEWSDSQTMPTDRPAKYASSYANYIRVNEEDLGSAYVSVNANEGDLIRNGPYYLHVLAVSDFNVSDFETFGPFYLDGQAPEISQSLTSNTMKKKEFNVTTKDLPDGTYKAGLNEITLYMSYMDKDGNEIRKALKLVSDGEINPLYSNRFIKQDDTLYNYVSDIEVDETSPLYDSIIAEIMTENAVDRIYVTYYYKVSDKAGNTSSSNLIKVAYDTRKAFEAQSDFTELVEIADPITTMASKAYDISLKDTDDGITISVVNDSDMMSGSVKGKFHVLVNDTYDYVADDASPKVIKITDLGPGYYELIPTIDFTISEGVTESIVSNSISFYLTDAKKDKTANYLRSQSNQLLTNKVYELNDAKYYYFDNDAIEMKSYLYGAVYDIGEARYKGGSSAPAFSSIAEAKNYVKYMEYQDLYLISISQSEAGLLNNSNGATIYTKASGETMIAQEGQLWIRYKKNTWTPTVSYGYAYYYYGSGNVADGVNITRLSQNLVNAINTVVTKIVGQGSTVYLVNGSNINQTTGEPYLSQSQYHYDKEVAEKTIMGSLFTMPIEYAGDKKIFSNTLEITTTNNNITTTKEYPIATHMVLSIDSSTILYYKYINGTSWTEIIASDGDDLSKVFKDKQSGIYTIREYSNLGINEFDIYFDKTAPRIIAEINSGEVMLDGTALSFSSTTFTLKEMLDEVDPMGYVAIFDYAAASPKTVLYKDDVNNYTLDSGNYYILVGDRSGNSYLYSVFLSSVPLQVELFESEDYGGVIVRLRNKDESEIYTYEIYLNDELIATEYRETYLFKNPGVYRVIVQDIYGNVFNDCISFEYKSPSISWYYQNSNGGLSPYNEENISNMIIKKDEASSKTWNIYTSTYITMLFDIKYSDSAVKFELKGLEASEYTYSEAAGRLIINVLKPWTLKIWYEDNEMNYATYVCRLDVNAPSITSTCIIKSYNIDSEFDLMTQEDYKNTYNDGDLMAPEDISYTESDGTTQVSFNANEVISANFIHLKFMDDSGVKSVSVMRDGNVVNAQLTNDQIVLNGYGKYVVTVLDNLNNSRTFEFENIKGDITKAEIDGEEINETETGNNNLSVTALYPTYSGLLVKTESGNKYYEFYYTGSILTSYTYYCKVTEDESGMHYGYEGKESLPLLEKDGNQTPNKWVVAASEANFKILVSFDTKNNIVYRVELVKGKIDVTFILLTSKAITPKLHHAVLSDEETKITLMADDEIIEVPDTSKKIFISDDLYIKEELSEEEEYYITYIKYAYSPVLTFEKYTTIYEKGKGFSEFRGSTNGFYSILVGNIYGNETKYTISKIDSFYVTVEAIYSDGVSMGKIDTSEKIYSNNSFVITAFGDDLLFYINGELASASIEDELTSVYISQAGDYKVRIVSSNGLHKELELGITSDPTFKLNENWIYGYNEKALRYSEGYTNTYLSVSENMDDVKQVVVVHDGEKKVIFDLLADDVINDKELLKESIGKDGDGIYRIEFRNIYGDVVSKEIHYSNSSTLILSRIRSGQTEREPYSLDLAIDRGFYSNGSLLFKTKSVVYKFIVNSQEVNLSNEKIYEFNNASGNGSIVYSISYIDEYGFECEFMAYLYRDSVSIDTEAMNIVNVSDTLYTKDDVNIKFDDDLTATVMVNSLDPIPYESGKIYRKDGTYSFVVTDIAGNENRFTIVHKSVNHFSIINSETEGEVINGGVANCKSVYFQTPASESAVIKKVYRNGLLLEDYNTNSFSKTAKWELLIEDVVGNVSYFDFYLINNSLGVFDYTVPYGYEITNIWKRTDTEEKSVLNGHEKSITLKEDGVYAVVMENKTINNVLNFTVTIDTSLPKATLIGVEDGGVTPRDVKITGLEKGDTITIYKDDVLMYSGLYEGASDVPTISEGGKYLVIVTNAAGVTKEFNFKRKSITNVAGSILIIVSCFVVVAGVFIGLLYNNKMNTDE